MAGQIAIESRTHAEIKPEPQQKPEIGPYASPRWRRPAGTSTRDFPITTSRETCV